LVADGGLFLFYYVKVAADVRSLERLRLVENWATNLAALPMLGAPWRDGRWIWIDEVAEKTNRNMEMGKMNSTLRDSLVIFSFSKVLFVNRGCTVLLFNTSNFRKKKKSSRHVSVTITGN